MTHWDPPAWDPPVVGGDRTPTPDAAAPAADTSPRLPPAEPQRPIHSWPTQRFDTPRPVALEPTTEHAPRRVPPWIWAGAACVAVAGVFAIAGGGGDVDQRAQLAPGGVMATGAEPSDTTIVTPATTSAPTTAAAPATAPTTERASEPEPAPTTAPAPAPEPTMQAPGTTPTTTPPAPATTVAVAPLLPQPTCHPSYTPCVPIDDDVDCAGGSGNGPSYVAGPITVIGPDDYGLDRDGDGVACER